MAFEDQFARIDGVQTRFWQAGMRGTPLVLIHGIASSVEDWRDNIAALSRDHQVYALDLVGCGLSDKPALRDYSPKALARFVLAFMADRKIDAAHLAGFSLGGNIAVQCARIGPERVRSLVLSAPAGFGLETIINFRLATIPMLGELLTVPNRFGMRMLMNLAFHDAAKVTPAMIEDHLRLARLPGAQQAFLKMLRSFVRLRGFEPAQVAELQSALPSVACPTLVVWGENDRFVPVAHARILENSLPDCRVVRIAGCGHLPQAERSDRFNSDVLAFLSQVEGRATARA